MKSLATLACFLCLLWVCHSQDTATAPVNFPRVCASCVQGKTCSDSHPCKGRAGATCKFHSCTGSTTTDKGLRMEFPLCKPTYYNADDKIITDCLEPMDVPTATPRGTSTPPNPGVSGGSSPGSTGSAGDGAAGGGITVSGSTGGASSTDPTPGGVVVCAEINDPVCGSDGVTYSSGCVAAANNVVKYTVGPCSADGVACPEDYAPVCGSNNKTYSNPCHAKAAKVKFTAGACDPKDDVIPPVAPNPNPLLIVGNTGNGTVGVSVDGNASSGAGVNDLVDVPNVVVQESKGTSINCTNTKKPVCGTDNVTYANSCVAKAFNVTQFAAGVCNGTVRDMIAEDSAKPVATEVGALSCPSEISKPVCGSDGRTYTNACEAVKANITSYTSGACSASRSFAGGNTTVCTMEYAPVCGPNNVTYSNKCLAGVAGFQNYTQGACGTKKTSSSNRTVFPELAVALGFALLTLLL